ncbi:MAG: phenylalanine--tRNA ligase subunit beta [Syntrophaceae bacterium]
MLVSLKWLKDYVDIELPVEELADKLTMAGLEVDSIKEIKPEFTGVVVGKIISLAKHPDADKLSLCEVSTGREVLPIVCGAPNTAIGQKVPLAQVGAVLPGGFKVKSSKIRGVQSEGMLCSEEELGIGSDNTGIMVLPEEFAPGDDLSRSEAFRDFVLDVGVTPNRSDCLSVIGMAREVAALTGKKLRYPEISFTETAENINQVTSVKIIDPELCPRYTARIIRNIKISQSPLWMRQRLEASGLRSINNAVDVTNFVMLELGQPLHAFDFRYLEEGRIVVRKSGEGEEFVSLDGKTRTLSANTLMICDGRKPVAVAGIMGGLNSEVQDDTGTVLLESAYFDPSSIRRSSKQLGMSTDAAFRFERGIDPEGVVRALNRAAQLLAETAGGMVSKNYIDEYPRKILSPANIPLRHHRVKEILGIPVDLFDIKKILQELEMQVRDGEKGDLYVTPPTFRTDIYREIDLIEEIARIHGYGNIPETQPHISEKPETHDLKKIVEEKVRTIFLGNGYTEVINFSFTSPQSADILNFGPESEGRKFVKIINPLTEDQSVMRTNLVYGLLGAMKRNVFSGSEDLKIFEQGKVFIARGADELPLEKSRLAALVSGSRYSDFWRAAESSDFYDIKGILEGILESLKITDVSFKAASDIPYLHPGRAAEVVIKGQVAGFIGDFHPDVLEKMDLKKKAAVFEIDAESIGSAFSEDIQYYGMPRYPAVTRDVAFILGNDIEAEKAIAAADVQHQDLLDKIEVFDIYTGKNIPEGSKSLALRFTYRSAEKTLTDDEVNKVHGAVVRAIMDATSAKIRGE